MVAIWNILDAQGGAICETGSIFVCQFPLKKPATLVIVVRPTPTDDFPPLLNPMGCS